MWNSTSKYKSRVWQCNGKHHGDTACKTPALRDGTIQDAFVRAVNQVIQRKAEIMAICEEALLERCDTTTLVAELSSLHAELEVVTELMQRQIGFNARVAMDQAEYQRQYDEYEARFNEIKGRIATLEGQKEAMTAKRGKITAYLNMLRAQNRVTEFHEALWYGTVDQVRIRADGTMKFVFMDGPEIEL